jgi:hypothetical protein
MGSFITGGFANLTGYALGDFAIEALAGRDANGAPKWRVSCGRCGDCQIVPHIKLAPMLESKATANLQCANGCQNDAGMNCNETFSQFRRGERRKAEETSRRAVEEQRKAEAEVVKQAAFSALKREWQDYYRHQLGTKIEISQIVAFERWRQLSSGTRKIIMERLRADPTAYFTGL